MRNNNSKFLSVGVILGALVLGIFLISAGDKVNQAPRSGHLGNISGQNNQPQGVSLDKLIELEDDDPVLGDSNAPVTLVEFGDYQCTFCTKFFKETEPYLIKEYVNTGKLKIVFRDLPINGSESNNAAEASECADDQGKFWEYHDKLFNERRGYQAGVFTDDNLKFFASELGLDVEEFSSCYDSGKHKSEINNDIRDAARAGARGTPNFFLNGLQIVGAQPISVFRDLIEQELNKL